MGVAVDILREGSLCGVLTVATGALEEALLLVVLAVSNSSWDEPKAPESPPPTGGVGAGVPSSDAPALLRLGRALSLGANLVWALSRLQSIVRYAI